MLGKVFKITAFALFGVAVCLLATAFICLKVQSGAFVYLFVSAFGAGIIALICNLAATLSGWHSERYDAFMAVLSSVCKISALVLFVAAIILSVVGYICATNLLDASGWLIVCACGGSVLAGLLAAIAIILDKSSTAKKTWKIFLLSTPFLIFIIVIGVAVAVGGAVLCFMLYAAGGILG